ncbi:MAG: outer membrane beta-barrel protein [Bacteroidota bacterium]
MTRRVLIMLLLGFICSIGFAQPSDDNTIPEDIPPAKKKKRSDPYKIRFFLLDVGLNTYLYDGSFTLPSTPFMSNGYNISDLELDYSRSINVNVHVYAQRINLVKRKLNIMHGLYLDISNYRFENDIRILPNEPQLTVISDTIQYKKNRMTTTFINVPLMLNVVSDPRHPYRSFRMSAGVFAGVLVGSWTKQKSDEFGGQRERDDFNLNKFRYGFRGELGFGPLNFYVTYSPISLFREGEGPELLPLNFGFMLIPF